MQVKEGLRSICMFPIDERMEGTLMYHPLLVIRGKSAMERFGGLLMMNLVVVPLQVIQVP